MKDICDNWDFLSDIYKLLVELLITTILIKVLTMKQPQFIRYVQQNLVSAWLLVFIYLYALLICYQIPVLRFLFLLGFITVMSTIVAVTTSTVSAKLFFRAFLQTACIFAFVTLYARVTRQDYSILDKLWFNLFNLHWIILLMATVALVLFHSHLIIFPTAIIGIVISSVYAIYTMQLINYDEEYRNKTPYVFSAISLYFQFIIISMYGLVLSTMYPSNKESRKKKKKIEHKQSPLTSFAEKLIDSGKLVVIHEEKELRKKISKPCQHSDARKSSGRESPLPSINTAQMVPTDSHSVYKWILSKLHFSSAVEEHDLNSSEQYCQCNNVPCKRKSIWFNEETVYDFEASSYCETESCEKSFCDCSSYSETESKHCQISDGRKSSGRESPLHSVSTAQMLPTNSHSLYKCILSKLLFSSAVEELHSSELYCQCKNVPRKRKSCEESCSESSSCREIESCKETCSESSSDRAPVNRKKVKTDSYPGGNLEIERHMETDPCEKSAAFPKENYSCKEEMTALCRSCQEEMADICQSCGQQRYFRKGQEPRLRRVYVKTPGGFFIDSSWTHVNCFIPVYPCPYILMPCLDVQSF